MIRTSESPSINLDYQLNLSQIPFSPSCQQNISTPTCPQKFSTLQNISTSTPTSPTLSPLNWDNLIYINQHKERLLTPSPIVASEEGYFEKINWTFLSSSESKIIVEENVLPFVESNDVSQKKRKPKLSRDPYPTQFDTIQKINDLKINAPTELLQSVKSYQDKGWSLISLSPRFKFVDLNFFQGCRNERIELDLNYCNELYFTNVNKIKLKFKDSDTTDIDFKVMKIYYQFTIDESIIHSGYLHIDREIKKLKNPNCWAADFLLSMPVVHKDCQPSHLIDKSCYTLELSVLDQNLDSILKLKSIPVKLVARKPPKNKEGIPHKKKRVENLTIETKPNVDLESMQFIDFFGFDKF